MTVHATHPDRPDRIDLRSDTFTQPTDAMRRAMANAPVGDDLFDEDPTMERLETKAARMLGKEAALFVPSGTMANLVAVLAHTDGAGGEVILDRLSHILHYESGGLSRVAHAQPRVVHTDDGVLTPELVRPVLRPHAFVHPRQRLIAIENTAGDHGGTMYMPDQVRAVAAMAHEHGLALHCDGARIMNAAVAQGTTPARLVDACDSVMFCVSKGLSAPVGSLLCGDTSFIEKATHHRKMVGGAMRQSGHLAAAAEVALDTMVERLAEDHARARRIAEAFAAAGFQCDPDRHPTNIVLVEIPASRGDAEAVAAALAAYGVLVLSNGPRVIRAVTHRHITEEKTTRAVEAIEAL